MNAYINGIGIISPLNTINGEVFVEKTIDPEREFFQSIEPNYKEYISPNVYRRLSRIIKMSMVASKICLQDAKIENPDAIITGTGLGCLEDTENFLMEILEKNEELLSPTPFIQSTHNTISSQIAVLLKCYGYNITFAHRAFSFESALLDSLMFIEENLNSNVLLGGVDEITPRLSKIKNHLESKWRSKSRLGNFPPGEGSAFFLLSGVNSENSYCNIKTVYTFRNPTRDTISLKKNITDSLNHVNAKSSEIDLVILGINGDSKFDKIYSDVMNSTFKEADSIYYKHLCGEYYTSTATALWIAANILKRQKIPDLLKIIPFKDKPISNILIYNHHKNINHSVILVSKC